MEIIIFPLSLLNPISFVSISILLALHRALDTFLLSKLLWERWWGSFIPPSLPLLLALIFYFHKRILQEQNSEDGKEMGKSSSQNKGKEGQSDPKLGTLFELPML